jgi:ATP-dependent helicase IRC3
MYGLTATDFRSDGKDIMIKAGVGEVLINRDLIWGIKSKWLAEPYFIVREVATTGADHKDDKLKAYRTHVLNSKDLNDRILNDIQKFLAAGKAVLCLVDQVDHGKMIAEAVGLPFATGEDKLSKEYVKQLNRGEIPGLIGTTAYIGEGTDTKNVDVLVLVNFVAGKGKLWQCLGRGMRLHGPKTHVVVLDYCPMGSTMLKRHSKNRIKLYEEITNNVRVIDV